MTSPDQHTVITPDLTATPDLLGTEAVLSRVPRSEHPTTDGRRSTHYDSLVGNCGRHDPHTKEIQSILNAIEVRVEVTPDWMIHFDFDDSFKGRLGVREFAEKNRTAT